MVSIRNSQDLIDIWGDIIKGKSHILWCDGLNDSRRKRSNTLPDECDEETDIQPNKKRKKMIRKNE